MDANFVYAEMLDSFNESTKAMAEYYRDLFHKV